MNGPSGPNLRIFDQLLYVLPDLIIESTAPRRSRGLLGGRGEDGGDSSTVSKLTDTFFFACLSLAKTFGFAPPFTLPVSITSLPLSQLDFALVHMLSDDSDEFDNDSLATDDAKAWLSEAGDTAELVTDV